MASQDYSIVLGNVRKQLGRSQALDGLSLTFDAGVMHGVIGPEGVGKTTLLRTLVGLLHPDSGTLDFQVAGQKKHFAEVRPHIAYMPGQQSLYADLSVTEHLNFFRALYRIPQDVFAKRSAELLRITRLEQFKDRAAGKLSGGMYKKLGLMCVLLHSPRILLLDEPTNGVDPISRREFWQLLGGLLADGILIIVSTAYMDEAERCGKVHLMQAGKLIAAGEPGALLRSYNARSIDELFLRQAAGGLS